MYVCEQCIAKNKLPVSKLTTTTGQCEVCEQDGVFLCWVGALRRLSEPVSVQLTRLRIDREDQEKAEAALAGFDCGDSGCGCGEYGPCLRSVSHAMKNKRDQIVTFLRTYAKQYGTGMGREFIEAAADEVERQT